MSDIDFEESNLSALQENIKRKGNNSYYYAHGVQITGPKWDGKEEPRLIATEAISVSSTRLKRPISDYAWADAKKAVKVYIEFENAHEVQDEDLELNSFEFKIQRGNIEHILTIPCLHDNINSAKVSKKPDKFIIALEKALEVTWYQLKKTNS